MEECLPYVLLNAGSDLSIRGEAALGRTAWEAHTCSVSRWARAGCCQDDNAGLHPPLHPFPLQSYF